MDKDDLLKVLGIIVLSAVAGYIFLPSLVFNLPFIFIFALIFFPIASAKYNREKMDYSVTGFTVSSTLCKRIDKFGTLCFSELAGITDKEADGRVHLLLIGCPDDVRRFHPKGLCQDSNRESPRLPLTVDIPAHRRRCETCRLGQLLLAHPPLLEQGGKFNPSQCCHSVPFLGCMWQKLPNTGNYRQRTRPCLRSCPLVFIETVVSSWFPN